MEDKYKKQGFTLMEILIALFIVAILLMITVPIVSRQLSKADEYSYYLAYKTVERMAGQIVAMGDPSEVDLTQVEPETKLAGGIKDFAAGKLDKVKMFFASAGAKFAKSQDFIFSRIMPKAFAAQTSVLEYDFDSSTYDDLWIGIYVCSQTDGSSGLTKKETKTKTNNADGTTSETTVTTAYSHSDFQNCVGYGKAGWVDSDSGKGYPGTSRPSGVTNPVEYSQYGMLEQTLFPSYCSSHYSNYAALASIMKNQNKDNIDAEAFCNNLVTNCTFDEYDSELSTTYHYTGSFTAEDEGSDDDDGDDDDSGSGWIEGNSYESKKAGVCQFYRSFNAVTNATGASSAASQKPTFNANYCNTVMGTLNMTNQGSPYSVDCVCKTGYEQTENNDRACCSSASLPSGYSWYYNSLATSESGKCVSCSGDFNPAKGTCCPSKSVYISGDTCTCMTGYEMKSGVCVQTKCPAGMTMDKDGVCVVNPPVLKAEKLCELIKDNYNLYSSNCTAGFGTGTYKGATVHYRSDVYAAASSAANSYLSIASKSGAFIPTSASMQPNVVFSNGLAMWILGDKAASIPGLSYTTTSENQNPSTNICYNLRKNTASKCKNADANAYFCKAENTCFTLNTFDTAALGDARNCCSSTDLSTLAAVTQSNPSAYDGGADAYKKDKRTYAISGFTVFIDIDGTNKGSGTLWDDVFPFYIGANGTVYPGYPLDAPKSADSASNSVYLGGNSEQQLAVDVYYYKADSTGNARQKVIPFPNVSYARGVCAARLLSKYTPYCLNVGDKFAGYKASATSGYSSWSDILGNDDPTNPGNVNPCDKNKCYVSVRQKLKSF